MSESPPTPLRAVAVPVLLTIAVSIARHVLEATGVAHSLTGGRLYPLGITWLVFVFGAWFAWRLARDGGAPRVRRAWPWALVPLLALMGTAVGLFAQIDPADRSDAAFASLRTSVRIIAAVAAVGAVVAASAWPRLAVHLFVYGLLVRAVVVVQTIVAKQLGEDTHYTKFGPAGIERDLPDTIASAALAQFGIWVPFTILAGTLAGCLVAGRRRAVSA